MKSILPNVCRKPESILWLLLQNCWQTKECLIYQLVPSTSISSICEHTFDNSPTDSSSSFLNWWSPKQRLETLYNWSAFFCQLAVSINAFSSLSFHVIGPRAFFAWGFSHPGNFSVAPAEIRDSNLFVHSSLMISFGLHSRWVNPKKTWCGSDVGSSISTCFIKFFYVRAIFCFFPAILMSSTCTDKNNPCFRWTKRHSQLGTFCHPSSDGISSNCLSHNNAASWCPYKFRSRGTTGSSMFDHDFCHWCPGRRIHIYIWTLWLWNSEQSGSVFQFYLSVRGYCISCLSVWQSCNNIHYLYFNHLGRRRALFSKNCIGSRAVFYNVTRSTALP